MNLILFDKVFVLMIW